MNFNISYITQGGSFPPYLKTLRDGGLYWNAGPPYMGTVRDMYEITRLWKEYVPRVYEEYPKLFAEMYGYIIATTQITKPHPIVHTLVKSLVVSTTAANGREGWSFIDDNDNLPNSQVCDRNVIFNSNDNENAYKFKKKPNLPVGLHYCGRYLLGDKWFFSKYRLKKKMISCEQPLLTYPPNDSSTRYKYAVRPPPDAGTNHESETTNVSSHQAKREAFMLCGLIPGVNEAARFYKSHHCAPNGEATWNETYDFHSDPNSTRR